MVADGLTKSSVNRDALRELLIKGIYNLREPPKAKRIEKGRKRSDVAALASSSSSPSVRPPLCLKSRIRHQQRTRN